MIIRQTITNLDGATNHAINAGAVKRAVERYEDMNGGRRDATGIFAYRFFNARGQEVGCFLPSMDAYRCFEEPREWSLENKTQLRDWMQLIPAEEVTE